MCIHGGCTPMNMNTDDTYADADTDDNNKTVWLH